MSLDRWPHVKTLFDEARQRPPGEREAFLTEACGDDIELRADVERLLEADDDAGGFFDTLGREIRGAADDEPLPERLGHWRVIREIGRGGMGRVLLADRADSEFVQRAAVKLVHAGLAPDLLARFRIERQILAQLEHAGIARLLDGGLADDGRPFLVMEYVEGEPITTYADRHRLSVADRLALFRQAGDAVAYAHRRLIVHRDIKPSNVLVTSDGGPGGGHGVKLLDFGIAKLLGDGDEGEGSHTESRLMTPAYAAPEQVRGDPVTTSTDVYSLGVLLYELLTGHRPYRTSTSGRREAEQAILDATPVDPSSAVGRTEERRLPDGTVEQVTPAFISAARGTEPGRLRKRLRGDLDRVVMMALRKEPDRRYGTAEAFMRDVDRHLTGLPVEARPASIGYRTGSFVRRHRIGVATTAAVVVLALAFGTLYTIRVARERDLAQAERERAERVTAFLTDMLAPADDPDADARALLVLLEPAAARAGRELQTDPAALAAVYHTLGRLYRRSGRPDRAETLLQRALVLRRSLHTEPHADVAATLHALGNHFIGRDRDSAVAFFSAAATMRRELSAGDDHDLAWSLLQWGRMLPAGHADKEAHYREALEMFGRLHGPRSREVADAMHEYHVLGFSDADGAGIEAAFREALAIYREVGDEESGTAIHAMHNLGLMLDRPASREESLRLLRESVELGRRALPPGSPGRVTMAVNFGATLSEHGRLEEADSVLRDAVDEARFTLPDSASGLGHSQYWYGINLLALGRTADAEEVLRSATDIAGRLGPGGLRYHRMRVELATAMARNGRPLDALEILREAAEALRGTRYEAVARERLLDLDRGGGPG